MQSEVIEVDWMHCTGAQYAVHEFQTEEVSELNEKAINMEAALGACRVAYNPDRSRMVSPLGCGKTGIQ